MIVVFRAITANSLYWPQLETETALKMKQLLAYSIVNRPLVWYYMQQQLPAMTKQYVLVLPIFKQYIFIVFEETKGTIVLDNC